MAEGPDLDDRDGHKKESILRWLKEVQMASDRGLPFNPAQTGYYAHVNPIGVATTDTHHAPHPQPHPLPSVYQSTSSNRRVQSQTKRSQSFSLLSRPLHTSSLSRRHPSHSNGDSKNNSPAHRPSPLVAEPVGSHLVESCDSVEPTVESREKPSKSTSEKKSEELPGDEQRLHDLRSLIRTRQSSLSPLPLPTAQPSLPTFTLSDVGSLLAKRDRLSKKLPTVTGIRQVSNAPVVKLLRASTSPSELFLTKPRSAPTSPRPLCGEGNREGIISQDVEQNEEGVSHSDVKERQKSFSHDDVSHLEQFKQLNVGGVSPAPSYELSDGDAPSNHNSLAVEEGSSEGEGRGERSDESFPSDEDPIRGDSEGSPSHQSSSPVDPQRVDTDSAFHTSHSQQHQGSQWFNEHKEDQKKIQDTSLCPISPPSVSTPRTPHSPLVRQRHISRSPSPSTSPFHKSRLSSSNSGTDSENVISKQKLKLLNEGQTFSFDTSEDSDLTKVSKQPKFLLKKSSFTPLSSCPISPPSLLPPSHRPPSSVSLSQYLSHHHHHHSHSDNPTPPLSSPTQPLPAPRANPVSKTFRPTSPVLSEQLFQRRGSTPVTLCLSQTSQGGPLSAKSSGLSAKMRSSLHSVQPLRLVGSTSPQTSRRVVMPKSIDEAKEFQFDDFQQRAEKSKLHREKDCELGRSQVKGSEQQSGFDKGSVNRQDSGIGTLSTTSNKCDFRV